MRKTIHSMSIVLGGLLCTTVAAFAWSHSLPLRAGDTKNNPTADPAAGKIDLDAFDALKQVVLLSNGQRLAYVDMGNPDGPPIVFIHAYTDSARTWVPMLPFVSKRFRLILVDLRGHGGSAKPECCYTHIDFAYDIKLLLDSLRIPKVDLVGHSLGSFVSQAFAEQWPERVRRVVLISSTGAPGACASDHMSGPDFGTAIHQLKAPLTADSPFMIAWWKSPKPDDPEFFRRARVDAAGIPLTVWWAMLDQGWTFNDLGRLLPRLKAPVLLLWGSADFIMTADMRQTLTRTLPTATVMIFKGLSHNPFWEDPPAVAAAINQFLEPPASVAVPH